MKSKKDNGNPHGDRVEMDRGLVEQCVESILLATGKMKDNQSVNFSLLPEKVVFYVDNTKFHEERLVCTVL